MLRSVRVQCGKKLNKSYPATNVIFHRISLFLNTKFKTRLSASRVHKCISGLQVLRDLFSRAGSQNESSF
jgi:hypothetical protein